MAVDVEPGTQLAGRYVLGQPISQGGMGTVYRATDRRTGAIVAVKLPHPHLARDPSYRERLRREAQLAAALTSPRIVRVTDLGEHDGAPFLVMEYVSGETLEDSLRREGTLPATQAATIAIEIARALEAAHALGIEHRDLKPQNIMLVEGRVKVLDFGVARAEGMAGLTVAGAFVGTPAYSAPERVGGGGDIRSDIYSLGVILFRLLAGALPFEAHTPQALLHRESRAPSLPDAVPSVLRRVVERCLALDPAARFETPTDLVAALGAVGVASDAPDLLPGAAAPAEATLALPQTPVAPPPTPVAPPPAKSPPPTNLPARLTSFVGRERELADVAERLRTARLTTLTGAGGSGKTRLAIEVAASTLTHYVDGVRLVELAPLTDPALVAPAVASVLGVREGRAQPAVEALVGYLRSRRLLLVLDNCEHLLDACASLADAILRACPTVHILATSRQALGITGERVWHVRALEVPRAIDPPAPGRQPPRAARLRAADVGGNEAVRLFVERAHAARADFSLTDDNALAVARICQRLDGLPLAIELAAARIKVLSAEQLAVRLDDRFRLLTGGRANDIPHHQTLRATVTWSYSLLGDAERVVFDRLSVFAGGFTLDLAEAVVGGAVAGGVEIAPGDVLDLLTQLVDKSLVQLVAPESDQGETRFDLLETLREYAGERLAAAGVLDAVRARHAAALLVLAEAADAQLTGPAATTWLDRLDTEHDNLRAALRTYLQQAVETPGAATSALRLAGALARFWDRRGHLAEGRRLLEETIGLAGLAPPDVDGALLARILNGAANLAHAQGDFRQASALHERALTLRRAAGDRRGIAASLYNLALAANEQGEYDRAAVLHAEALELRRALGDTPGLILSLASLGLAAEMQGDDAQAAGLSRESLALARDLGDARLIAYPLLILGRALYRLGQPAPALASLEESRSLFNALGDVRWVAYAHRTLGDLALLGGDLVAARRHMQASLVRFRGIGEQWGVALALEGMGAIAEETGRWKLAARFFGAAGALRHTINGPLAPASAARAEVERRVAAVRAALGDADFEAATAAGAGVDLDLTVDVALEALTVEAPTVEALTVEALTVEAHGETAIGDA